MRRGALDCETIHANCIAVDDKGLLILGGAGSGKSTLSLQLLGMGGTLVADDRTIVSRKEQKIMAHAPDVLQGLIEARGLGILSVPWLERVDVAAVVDLDRQEQERLPPVRTVELLGIHLPCLYNGKGPAFASALFHFLRYKRNDDL